MSNTSLLRLRQRQRYFDPSLRDATRSLQLLWSKAKLRATRRSVQISTSAQCPIRDIPPSSQQIKFGYPARF
ncbi:hypothetical protein [Nostoc sp.]